MLILGWLLLPLGFILGLVALVGKKQPKSHALGAVITSVLGTILAVIVFVVVIGQAVDQAIEDTKVTTTTASGDSKDTSDSEDASSDETAELGKTRENPLPLGATIESSDWKAVVNSVNLAATDLVTAENSFNKAPGEGNTYILVNLTVTYLGDDAQGQMPTTTVKYVTSGGNTIESYDTLAIAPESIDLLSPLFKDASVSGNIVLEVPAADVDKGVLAVSPEIFADSVFVSVK